MFHYENKQTMNTICIYIYERYKKNLPIGFAFAGTNNASSKEGEGLAEIKPSEAAIAIAATAAAALEEAARVDEGRLAVETVAAGVIVDEDEEEDSTMFAVLEDNEAGTDEVRVMAGG